MKSHVKHGTREAIGCFVMLILAACMAIGVMSNVTAALGDIGRGAHRPLWQSVRLWVVAPATGIIAVAWSTYGFKGLAGRKNLRWVGSSRNVYERAASRYCLSSK